MTTPLIELEYVTQDASKRLSVKGGNTFRPEGLLNELLDEITRGIGDSDALAGVVKITAHTDKQDMPSWKFSPQTVNRLSHLRVDLELVVVPDLPEDSEDP